VIKGFVNELNKNHLCYAALISFAIAHPSN